MRPRRRVLIPLAPGYEETEALAPADVLSRSGIEVVLAHLPGESRLVRGSHGFVLEAHRPLDETRAEDYLGVCLPGGMPGTRNLGMSGIVRGMLHDFYDLGRVVAAICAAPTVLHACGLLSGRRVTSHPSAQDALAGAEYVAAPVVIDSPFVTSRGPGTALLFGLTLVACASGQPAALELADAMLIDVPDVVREEWDRWVPTS